MVGVFREKRWLSLAEHAGYWLEALVALERMKISSRQKRWILSGGLGQRGEGRTKCPGVIEGLRLCCNASSFSERLLSKRKDTALGT